MSVSYTHLDVYKRQVYDGTFTGTLTDGDGLCARLLVGLSLIHI